MSGDDWKRTLRVVDELSAQVEQVGLLRGAIASGFLAHCREPVTPAELADATGLERDLVDDVCDALRATGALVGGADGRVVISELYAPLLVGGLHERALERLAAAEVRGKMLRGLFEGEKSSYWSIDSVSRIALAASATGNPLTDFGRERLVAGLREDPVRHEIFHRGGRFLDLGCGVAGAIVSFLHYYPRLVAVGIDIADDVLEVARARAQALGVSDRATFLVADAASFRDPEPFDVVFWPQTFYPEPSRAAALATCFVNLRPGGLLVTVHVPPPAPRLGRDGRPDPGVGRVFEPLLRKLWGIRERSLEVLTAELEAAGFVDVTAAAATPPSLPLVRAYRPVSDADQGPGACGAGESEAG